MNGIRMTALENAILDYLNQNSAEGYGVSNYVLSKVFEVSEREARRAVENIILNGRAIIGNTGGYWVARTPEEAMRANRLNKSRLKKSVEKYYANGIENRKWLHSLLNELDAKYPVAPEGQLDIDGNRQSYYQ